MTLEAGANENPGKKYYLAGLDASKAFPSVSRQQFFLVLSRVGLPQPIIGVLAALCEKGYTHFKLLGSICEKNGHKLCRGIHQGCPLSVMCYNALVLPLIMRLSTVCPTVNITVCADDLILWSESKAALESALREVSIYMDHSLITLNPTKTRYWVSDGVSTPLEF